MKRMSKHKHKKKENIKPYMYEPRIAQYISKKVNISEDILAKAPIITAYGCHRFCVENYKNIIEYTDTIIRIQTKTGKIHFIGKNLTIAYYRNDGMCVVGNIEKIEYH